MSLVHGTVAPGYEKVREVFAAEAARPGDVAAQLAVYGTAARSSTCTPTTATR